MKSNTAVLLACIIAALPLRAQQPADNDKTLDEYYASPFSLPVSVYFQGDKTDPVHAAFIYRTVREVPNVVVVGDQPQMSLRMLLVQNGRTYAFTLLVLEPANPVFRDVVADRVELKLQAQGVNRWHQDGDLVRDEIMRMRSAYFFVGAITYTGPDANAVINTAIKAFDANYVEPRRVQDHDTKEAFKAAAHRIRDAKTPQERQAAADEMRKLLGLPEVNKAP